MVDLAPDELYAPVASHEALRALLALVAAYDLIVEGGHFKNIYLLADVDCDIFIEKTTDSSGQKKVPGMVCKLLQSIYGLVRVVQYGYLYHADSY